MVRIEIDVRGITKTSKRFKTAKKRIKKFEESFPREVSKFVKQAAKTIVSSQANDTGQLASSIKRRTTKNSARVFTDAPHAAFVEFGVRPHKVFPWMLGGSGSSVGAWQARHGIPQVGMIVGDKGVLAKPGLQFMGQATKQGIFHTERLISRLKI